MNLANLARQSHAMLLAWRSPCIIRPHCAADGEAGGAGGGTEEEQGRGRCALQISQDSRSHISCLITS